MVWILERLPLQKMQKQIRSVWTWISCLSIVACDAATRLNMLYATQGRSVPKLDRAVICQVSKKLSSQFLPEKLLHHGESS